MMRERGVSMLQERSSDSAKDMLEDITRDEVPKISESGKVVDEREDIRSESLRMLNRLKDRTTSGFVRGRLPPGVAALQRDIDQRRLDAERSGNKVPLIEGPVTGFLSDVVRGAVSAEPVKPTNPSEAYRLMQGFTGAYLPTAPVVRTTQAARAVAQQPTASLVEAGRGMARAGDTAAEDLVRLLTPPKGPEAQAGAIRIKGSNTPIFPESIEKGLEELVTPKVRGMTPAQRIEENKKLLQTEETEVYRNYFLEQNRRLEKDAAIDEWVNRNLNKYLRSQFASTEDPVRALLERENRPFSGARSVLERYDELNLPRVPSWLKHQRESLGLPGEGLAQSEAAKEWEMAADRSVRRRFIEDDARILKIMLQEVPQWYKKYLQDNPGGAETLFPDAENIRNIFGHVVDVLRADVISGRISPSALKNISVDQAVQRTMRFDEEMARAAKKAEKEAKKEVIVSAPRFVDETFQPSFVDKPGGKWINLPEAVEEGLESCTSIGKAGGWCTQSPGLAQAYGSGSNRLIALVDAEGRPHAQITYKPNWLS